MWIYPTYNRPKECRVMLEQMSKVGCATPGIIILQGLEKLDEYREAFKFLPKDWVVIPLQKNIGFCGALNLGYSISPHSSFYGALSDDEFIMTSDWDATLVKAAGDWYIAHGNDDWQSEFRIHGGMTFGGELVRTIGYLAPPGLWHWYIDNFWEYIAAECGLRKFCRDVLIEDRHYMSGKSEYDDTYRMGESRKVEDEKIFRDWQEASKPLITKIKDSLPRKSYNFVEEKSG